MRYKFPRTPHLPCSASKTDDDKTLPDYSNFEGQEVVITTKMDGESFTIYSDGYTHARSIDSRDHESRSFAKRIASFKTHLIPDGWRLSCENLFAKHSILYTNLKGYLYLFGAWDNNNNYISYYDLLELNKGLRLPMPDLIYRGQFSLDTIDAIIGSLSSETEGFVIRNSQSFHYNDYVKNTGKFVRAGHVQTDEHWMHQKIIANLVGYPIILDS